MCADRRTWRQVSRDDAFLIPSGELPIPLQSTAPLELNLEDLTPANFEKLIAALAEHADAAKIAYLYGVPGQNQHGIDLIAKRRDGSYRSYQAKRYKRYTKTNLVTTVRRYLNGSRPFEVTDLVIAVACEARRTEILDELAILERSSGLDIELWDKGRISDRLRGAPEVVAQYFGAETARLFCPLSLSAVSSSLSDERELADAARRGPLRALDLQGAYELAERQSTSDPERAAVIFAKVAERLESNGYQAHAHPVYLELAKCQELAGLYDAAFDTCLRSFWRQVDGIGETFELKRTLDVAKTLTCSDPARSRSLCFAFTVPVLIDGIAGSLDRPSSAFEALAPSDPFFLEAAVCYSEHLLALREVGKLASSAGSLKAILGEGRSLSPLRMRLNMVLAEVEDTWTAFMTNARRELTQEDLAWVTARYGRSQLLAGRIEEAVSLFEDAVERACVSKMDGDAANWLYALREARHWGVVRRLGDDEHHMAQRLRASALPSALPGNATNDVRALRSLSGEIKQGAIAGNRRWLWESVVRADLASEFEALEGLASAIVALQSPVEALRYYIWSNHGKRASQVAQQLPDRTINFGPEILAEPRPLRVAAYKAFEACSDIVSDDTAALWLDPALDDLVERTDRQHSTFYDLPLASFSALSSIGELMTIDFAGLMLATMEPWVDRNENAFRRTDKSHAKLLVRLAESHSGLARPALEQLCRGLVQCDDFENIALGEFGARLMAQHGPLVADILWEHAEAGVKAAANALAVVGIESEAVHVAADQVAEKIINRPHDPPNQRTIWADTEDLSVLARYLSEGVRELLAERLQAIALDLSDGGFNRIEALNAITYIGREAPEDLRATLFECVRPVAVGQSGAAGEGSGTGLLGSLDLVFSGGGEERLRASGIRAWCALASRGDQREEVLIHGLRAMSGASEESTLTIVRGLAQLKVEPGWAPLDLLSSHPSHAVRSLAAIYWAQDPTADEVLGLTLANDPQKLVRRTLASHLSGEVYHRSVRDKLSMDARRSVRIIARRVS